MNRTGLIVALAIAVIAGVVFGLYPEIELAVARHFHAYIDNSRNAFAWRIYPPLMKARDVGLWVTAVLVVPAVAALVIKLILPKRKLLMSGRAIVFLIATLALAPGLMVNVLLKDHWDRPRPIDVTQFGGKQHFVPWWDPRGDCPNNCSFVSGDVSGAFWTIAPAALAPPQWRALAYGAALAFGVGMAYDARDGGRAFRQRRHFRRRVHVPDHLDRARLDLPLAAHAAVRRGDRASDRAHRHAGL